MTKSINVSDDYKFLLRQIGINLSKARKEKGISQRELGRSAAKNPSMIAKVEKFAPMDISMRNIYEVARLIPVSLGEIILKSERDLELHSLPREPQKLGQRLTLLMEKLADLTVEEQTWLSDMIEGLLTRTSAPSKLTDRTDKRSETANFQ
jgi:transcriptional regulator with XRE-family HTH domain